MRTLLVSAFLSALSFLAASPVAAGPPPVLRAERGAEILSPGLRHLAATAPRREIRVWVFFTDKGVADAAAYRTAVDETGGRLGERARLRRLRAGAPLDFTDLSVHGPYVNRLRADGFAVRRVSRWLNAASVTTRAGDLHRLEALPFVRFVQPVLQRRADREVDPGRDVVAEEPGVLPTAAAPDSALEAWFYGPSRLQLGQIQALDLHRLGYTGAGVRVMVLDTGFQKTHAAFGTCTNLVAEYDFVNDDGNTQNEGADSPSQHNHGTGCWGALGGYAPGALIGPAWAAEFVLAKTEDIVNEVRSEEDDYVAALEWGDTLGVDVTSASLAYFDFDDGFTYTLADLDGDTAVITRAVDLAVAKGIVCVNAMGNSGPNASTLFTPADADSVIAVGAVDSLGNVASFSSRGPTGDGRTKPEVCARGVATYWARAWTGGYGPANGTSLSTPLIGGLAALIKEAQPAWSGHDVRVALMGTASQSGAPDNAMGWGIARGQDAITYLGAVPELPRMTLPFALAAPADGAVMATLVPTLVWCSSSAPRPGDAAEYTVFLDRGGAIDTVDAGPDTTLALPFALAPGDSVAWWVHAVGNLGYVRKSMDLRTFTVSAALDAALLPGGEAGPLPRAWPNPARAGTRIAWMAPDGEAVELTILSASGRLVRRFDLTGTGTTSATAWDLRRNDGAPAPPGVYFYSVRGRSASLTGRLVLIP